MINFNGYANENKTVQKLCSHNSKWWYIPDHPYRILIIGGSGSGKLNALLNLINKRESTGLKHFNDPEAFIEYSNDMQGVYKNINEYNEDKEHKTLNLWWYDSWYG